MILNFIQINDFEFYKKYILKILITLTSIFLLVNKSLIISIFSFSTAAYNAVWWNYNWISFKYIILNGIQISKKELC